jgi:threonylcarbamoyladenosine tRNA methylthiotransferase MtaB
MKRVFVHSFGCRASQADGAGIRSALAPDGFSASASETDADLVVLNTCTVTTGADGDARQAIRRVRRNNPAAKILVTGCYAQRAPEEIASIDGVTWVVGNSHKDRIAELIANEWDSCEEYHGRIFASDIAQQRQFSSAPVVSSYADRTRPTLKVQDGCSNKCSFCIIPDVRGRSRSASLESVLHQMSTLADQYAEVVISGINLGRWGRDLPGNMRFTDLVRIILEDTGVKRLRISSVEPMDWSAELLKVMSDEPRLAQHIHLPLQSGSDSVLKRMYRKYRVRHYASRLELAHRLMPDAAIGADVMTGFPRETDAEFQETVDFIRDQPFTYLHVFTYSERPGTAAAEYPDAVPVAVRRERTNILRNLSDEKNATFRQRMLGRELSCVTLPGDKALSSNYLSIDLTQPRNANEIVDVLVGSLSEAGLREKALLHVLAG